MDINLKHTPEHDAERIVKAGGKIINKRINGNLSFSRSIGDLKFKNNSKLMPEAQLLTNTSDLYQIKADTGDILMMASDGVWEGIQPQKIKERLRAFENLKELSGSIFED